MLVDISGVKKRCGKFKFLDCKRCFKGILVFSFPLHCSVLVEHDPRQHMIAM